MLGYGGTILPHILTASNGFFSQMFVFTYPPLNGGQVPSDASKGMQRE
jgi:hypothetical protein